MLQVSKASTLCQELNSGGRILESVYNSRAEPRLIVLNGSFGL